MEVTISIPDKFAGTISEQKNISRQMLEAYAVENYRQEKMSFGQIAELLGLSVDETNVFLKKHRVPLHYDFEDLEEDRKSVEMFLKK